MATKSSKNREKMLQLKSIKEVKQYLPPPKVEYRTFPKQPIGITIHGLSQRIRVDAPILMNFLLDHDIAKQMVQCARIPNPILAKNVIIRKGDIDKFLDLLRAEGIIR